MTMKNYLQKKKKNIYTKERKTNFTLPNKQICVQYPLIIKSEKKIPNINDLYIVDIFFIYVTYC